jgi:hypothetical protein
VESREPSGAAESTAETPAVGGAASVMAGKHPDGVLVAWMDGGSVGVLHRGEGLPPTSVNQMLVINRVAQFIRCEAASGSRTCRRTGIALRSTGTGTNTSPPIRLSRIEGSRSNLPERISERSSNTSTRTTGTKPDGRRHGFRLGSRTRSSTASSLSMGHDDGYAEENKPIFDGDDTVTLEFVRDITERTQRARRFEATVNDTYTGLLEPGGTLVEANDTALSSGSPDRDDVIGTPLWETEWVRTAETRRIVREGVELPDGSGDSTPLRLRDPPSRI